jgi:PAS domain S-box-containing protein
VREQSHWDAGARALAVLEGLSGKPATEICRERQISPDEFDQWRDQFVSGLARSFKAGSAGGGQSVDVPALLAVLGRRRDELSSQLHVAQQLIDSLPVPVFFKGRDGRYLGMNKAWEAFFGRPRETYIGKTIAELYPDNPEIIARHEKADEDLWRDPGSRSYEIPVVGRDGRKRYILMFKATFSDSEGAVVGMIGTIIDITDRRQAEHRQAIEAAVTRLLGESVTLADAVRGIIRAICDELGWVCGARWSYDDKGHVLRCMETWAIEDPKIAAFMQQSSANSYVPSERGLVRRVLATGKAVWIEDVAERPDFQRARIAAEAGLHAAFALPLKIGARVLGAIEFYSRDAAPEESWIVHLSTTLGSQIGQLMIRRQAEAALRESEARFRSLTALSSDWYWEQDENLRFVTMSRGMYDSIGARPEEYLGKTRWEQPTIGVSEEEWEAHKQLLGAHRPFQDFEFGRRSADGSVFYVSISGEPILDADKRFRGYRGVGRDITRRKLAQSQLREANEELERKAQELARSNEELQQFAYVASHDLQEPLRMISSYTQLLERRYGPQFDQNAKEFMAFIVDGAARMKQLIEDLLAYSRVGTRGREFRDTDVNVALKKALANLRGAIDARGAEITIAPLPTLVGDETQLTQLFQNLIGNGLKFKAEGTPEVNVSVKEEGHSWHFTVADNGIGIEPQYFERIFLMFQRLHGKGEYPGTGIGLTICKKIVDRHGGRIWVESEPGQGCTFHITLPKKQEGENTK